MDIYFNKNLIDKITETIEEKMKPFVIEAREQMISGKWGKYIYDTLFGKDLVAIRNIPDYWFFHYKHIEIDCYDNDKKHFLFEFDLGSLHPFPIEFNSDLAEQSIHCRCMFTLKDHPVWKDFREEVNVYAKCVNQVIKDKIEFVTLVSKLCNSCGTLEQALEVWPPLWDLLPDDIMEKYQKFKTQKRSRKPKEVVLDIDIERLTTLMTAVKLKNL